MNGIALSLTCARFELLDILDIQNWINFLQLNHQFLLPSPQGFLFSEALYAENIAVK
jgi:hypothetical protein